MAYLTGCVTDPIDPKITVGIAYFHAVHDIKLVVLLPAKPRTPEDSERQTHPNCTNRHSAACTEDRPGKYLAVDHRLSRISWQLHSACICHHRDPETAFLAKRLPAGNTNHIECMEMKSSFS